MSSEQDVNNLLRPPQSSSPFTIVIPPVEDRDVPMRETRKASGSRGSREVSATLNVRSARSSRSRSASAVSSEDPLHIDSPEQSADIEVAPVARGDKLNADDEIVKILSIQRSAGMPTSTSERYRQLLSTYIYFCSVSGQARERQKSQSKFHKQSC